jgi:hypothetical protein
MLCSFFVPMPDAFTGAGVGSPDIPDYSIRVMRDGTEAEIVGGFKYGLTDDFTKTLSASRDIKIVHLDSLGGRIGEGRRMFELIRDRGLSTYVSARCASACTLAFAGGKERYLHKRATLGFHRGAYAGVDEGDFEGIQADVFRRAGFDPSFIQTALSTPHKDLWRPGSDILLRARVITQVSDGAEFAYSGLGSTNISREVLSKRLVDLLPTFKAMQELYPAQFASLVDDYSGGIASGKSERETMKLVRARFVPFLASLTPRADDDVVIAYIGLMVDQYVALRETDVTDCYNYASGSAAIGPRLDFPQALVRREQVLQERAMRTAAKREALPEATKQALWARIREQLAASGVSSEDLDLLGKADLDRGLHGKYCAVAIKMFEEIARLPHNEAAAVMRNMMESR